MPKLVILIVLFCCVSSFTSNVCSEEQQLEVIQQKESSLEAASGKEKITLLDEIIALSQDSYPDIAVKRGEEILQLIRPEKEPRLYAKHLSSLTSTYINISDYEKAEELIQISLDHAVTYNIARLSVNALMSRATIQRDRGSLDKSYQTLEDALKIAKETDKSESIAKVLYQQAIVHYFKGDLGKAETTLSKSRVYFTELGDRLWLSKVDNIFGILYGTQGLFEESLEAMLSSYEVVKELGDIRKQGVLLNNIALTFKKLDKDQDALDTYQQALELSQKVKDRHSETLAILNIGNALFSLDRYDEALQYFERGLELSEDIESPSYKLRALSGIIDIAKKNDDVEEVYQLSLTANELAKNVDDHTVNYGPKKDLIWVNLQRGNYEEALSLLKPLLELIRKQKDKDQELQALEMLTETYEGMKNYQAALSSHQEYMNIYKDVYSEQSDRAIATMRARFEAKEKDTEIELLTNEKLAQDNQIKANQLALENKKLERNAIIVAAILVIIVLFLIYNRRLQRQVNVHLKDKVRKRTQELDRKNKELEAAYNRAEEISFRDELTGLHNRRYLFNNINDEAKNIIQEHQARKDNEDSNLVFLVIDIDHFKRINDQYGHSTGDYILSQFGRLLVNVFRQTDYVIRWGGEEFLVVMRSANRQLGKQYAERLRDIVENHSFTDANNKNYNITCSIGYSAFPCLKQDVTKISYTQVIDIADTALYCAKRSGRNAWVGLDFWATRPDENLVMEMFRDPETTILKAEPYIESSVDTQSLKWETKASTG